MTIIVIKTPMEIMARADSAIAIAPIADTMIVSRIVLALVLRAQKRVQQTTQIMQQMFME